MQSIPIFPSKKLHQRNKETRRWFLESAETSNHSSRLLSSSDSNMPPERVRFPRIWTRRFYSCMCCSNHILGVPRPNNYQNAVVRAPRVVICNAHQMVNVRFGRPRNSRIRNGVQVVRVYCNQCGQRIGERFTSRGLAYDEPAVLFRSRLLYWDGYFTIYADSLVVADVDNDGIDTR